MNLGQISKAIAGGLVGAGVAEAARYGFQPDAPTVTALTVIVTGVVGYVVGHVLVFLAPKNSGSVPVQSAPVVVGPTVVTPTPTPTAPNDPPAPATQA